MPLSMVLDILIAALLVITIGYAVVLNRRLAGLRKNKDELEALFATFSQTTKKADEGVRRLKATSAEIEAALGGGMSEARTLREDLSYLIERGTDLADRLEGGIRDGRKDGAPTDSAGGMAEQSIGGAVAKAGNGARRPTDPGDEMPEPNSEAERELLKALRSVR